MGGVDILVIEDNRHDVEMILETISEQDISDSVYVINDGAEAIDYFFGPEGCVGDFSCHLPKLILLDLKLPKVSGLEVLKSIKSDERTKYIPTVVFTSSNEARDRTESYLLGANSYIVKPMDADMFSRFVADIGSYWVFMNRSTYDGA
ncbi:MAG TPA: response regulator [Syntrophales bacterium]|nr:response regulator [Syntrophales bacterium]